MTVKVVIDKSEINDLLDEVAKIKGEFSGRTIGHQIILEFDSLSTAEETQIKNVLVQKFAGKFKVKEVLRK